MSEHDRHAAEWTSPAFIRAFLLIVVIIVGLAALTNFIVDPFDIYGIRLLPPSQFNNYKKKLELFDGFNPNPSALILGSSRVMSCDPNLVEELTGERCFNFWLPGSGAETYFAVLNLVLAEREDPIDLIIVGVGVETVHPALPIQPEARFVPEISKWFVHDPDGQATVFEKLGLLFTMDQTVQSGSVILSTLRGRDDDRTMEAGQPKLEYRDDGFTLQAHAEAMIADGTFNLEETITRRLRRKRYTERGLAVSGWIGLSETRQAYWQDFLDICEARGIRVYAFMTPAHPRLWEVLEEFDAQPVYEEVAEYFERTVGDAGGIFRDFSRLESFGGDPDLFYDEIHMRKPNCDLLLRELLSSEDGEM